MVVVKNHEVEDYKAMWPSHVMFELPDQVSKLGIGAARHAINELAKLMIPHAVLGTPRFAFVMDDSVLCWKV